MFIKPIIKSSLMLLLFLSINGMAASKVIVKTTNSLRSKTMSTSSLFSNDSVLNVRGVTIKKASKGISASFLNQTSTWVLSIKDDASVDEFIEEAKLNSTVIYAEPVYPVEVFSTPNDPYYNDQYYLKVNELQKIVDLVPVNETIVAVLDTGVDVRHLDIETSIYINTNDPINGIDDDSNGIIDDYNGANFTGFSDGESVSSSLDEHGHGTHIAGIIAAQSNNSEGITGLNSKAKILNVRFLDQFGRGNQLDAAAAIIYAVDQGAQIINCSWGYFKSNTILKEAVEYAIENGVIVVAAIGNSNTNLEEYPASYDGVYSIGSVGSDNTRSYFSSFGDHLDFQFYGESLVSPVLNDAYGFKSGTSQSSAVMTGVISKFLSMDPTLSSSTIYNALLNSSSLQSSKSYKNGYGTIDINTLIPLLGFNSLTIQEVTTVESSIFTLNTVMNFPNPIPSSGTTFGFETDTANLDFTIRVFNLLGGLEKKIEGLTTDGYNRVTWVPSGMFSGTYVYLLEVSSTQKSKTKRGKLSIL
jgi:subtilisin family serine protease